MNIKQALDEALASGLNFAVCHPSLYDQVLMYVRGNESKRGPQSFRRPMEIAIHIAQKDPPILIFDTQDALREHLSLMTPNGTGISLANADVERWGVPASAACRVRHFWQAERERASGRQTEPVKGNTDR